MEKGRGWDLSSSKYYVSNEFLDIWALILSRIECRAYLEEAKNSIGVLFSISKTLFVIKKKTIISRSTWLVFQITYLGCRLKENQTIAHLSMIYYKKFLALIFYESGSRVLGDLNIRMLRYWYTFCWCSIIIWRGSFNLFR